MVKKKSIEVKKTSRGLTQRQMGLVDNIVTHGYSHQEAAEEAGYAKGKSAQVMAYKTLKLPHVQEYMMQRIGQSFGVHAARASAKLGQLVTGARSEYVQLEASKDILDRAGFKPIDRSQVQIAGDLKISIDLSG